MRVDRLSDGSYRGRSQRMSERELLNSLHNCILSLGYDIHVVHHNIDGQRSIRGQTDHLNEWVLFRSDLTMPERLEVAAHELSHIVLQHCGRQFTHGLKKNQAEVEAQLCSGLVLNHFGHDDPYTDGYVENWMIGSRMNSQVYNSAVRYAQRGCEIIADMIEERMAA